MYCEPYKEIARMLTNPGDIEDIYDKYRGLSITFPMKLYCRSYVYEYLSENCDKKDKKEMAKHLGLTERRVRQLISQIKKDIKKQES